MSEEKMMNEENAKSLSFSERRPEGEAEFYIGWMPQAPDGFAKHVKKVVLILLPMVILAAILLATQQRKFSTATFEYGQLTEIKGIFHQQPVPSLKVITKQDVFGQTEFITLPLVGYGKFGAEGTIAELEKENKISLEGMEVTFKGTLLYSDGKTLLQIDRNDKPMVNLNENFSPSSAPIIKELGDVELHGEILDPKCYFGVMKPGHGKPHRDCAARCIAGGMSPVFYVRNENGQANYYLILDMDGKKMNDQLLEFIAEPVSLKARAVQNDDWIILYVHSKENIKRTGGLSLFKSRDEIATCKPSKKK